MSDSVRPQRRQPIRLPCPWDSPGKNTGVGCHFLFQCMKGKSESEVTQSCLTLSDPMDCSLPGSSIHGIFRQEYWSGVPLPSPPSILQICICIQNFFPSYIAFSCIMNLFQTVMFLNIIIKSYCIKIWSKLIAFYYIF